MDFKIEKGVPVPPLRVERISKYPFKEMEIGDSFEVNEKIEFSRVRNSLSTYSARSGRKFVTRKTENGGRIWRVE